MPERVILSIGTKKGLFVAEAPSQQARRAAGTWIVMVMGRAIKVRPSSRISLLPYVPGSIAIPISCYLAPDKPYATFF